MCLFAWLYEKKNVRVSHACIGVSNSKNPWTITVHISWVSATSRIHWPYYGWHSVKTVHTNSPTDLLTLNTWQPIKIPPPPPPSYCYTLIGNYVFQIQPCYWIQPWDNINVHTDLSCYLRLRHVRYSDIKRCNSKKNNKQTNKQTNK